MLARLFGFGVLMGQGALFGGPRPVKADVVTSRGQAA
jgi:cyclic-di-GMP phosphodiesterase TipF (flagellum assembly factor)